MSAPIWAKLLLAFLAYWLAWHFALLFEVQPNVSALYPIAGLSLILPALIGPAVLPVTFLSIGVVPVLGLDHFFFSQIDWMGSLRQSLVYGLAGLWLHSVWNRPGFRFSFREALRFVLVAIFAAWASAALAMALPPHSPMLPEARLAFVISFWGGDFAGVMFTVPVVALVRHWIHHSGAPTLHAPANSTPTQQHREQTPSDWLGLLLSVALLWLLCLYVAHAVPAVKSFNVLLLIPVLVAALRRGILFGLLAALLIYLLELVATHFGLYPGHQPVIDRQLLLATASAIALLAGASHDDIRFEWQRANFDPLTGLANRHRFDDQLDSALKRAQRSAEQVAVVYLDLDHFKSVNDNHGHHTGDLLLKEVAQRLLRNVRNTDTVARFGGDEFSIVLSGERLDGVVARISRALLHDLAQPYRLQDKTVNVSASIGVALFPQDGQAGAELEIQADQALYAAKLQGRHRFVFYRDLATTAQG